MNDLYEAEREEARDAARDRLTEVDRQDGCSHEGGFNRRGKSCHWCGLEPEL